MKQNDLTFEGKMTELRMEIPHPNNRNKVFLLLEGDSDVRLYRKLCNNDTAKVEMIPGGKFKLEECLIELCKQCPRIIGIRDADFLHLEGKSSPFNKLFLTDFHDMEIMIAACDDVFSAILCEFSDKQKETHAPLKVQLLESLRFMSCFRWHNDTNRIGLAFEHVGFNDLFDIKNFNFNKQQYVQKVVLKSPNAKIKDPILLLLAVEQLSEGSHELLQLCNGHDFMKITALYLSKFLKKGIGEDTIAAIFRIAYSINHFKTTQLYKNINAWAANRWQIFES
jgi:Protein of unknown function (DUF4435)